MGRKNRLKKPVLMKGDRRLKTKVNAIAKLARMQHGLTRVTEVRRWCCQARYERRMTTSRVKGALLTPVFRQSVQYENDATAHTRRSRRPPCREVRRACCARSPCRPLTTPLAR